MSCNNPTSSPQPLKTRTVGRRGWGHSGCPGHVDTQDREMGLPHTWALQQELPSLDGSPALCHPTTCAAESKGKLDTSLVCRTVWTLVPKHQPLPQLQHYPGSSQFFSAHWALWAPLSPVCLTS